MRRMRYMLSLITAFLVLMLFGCKGLTLNTVPTTDNRKYEIYQLAQAAGYNGTYDDWLESIRGNDGSMIYSGEGIPENSLGKEQDLYLDLLTLDLYQKQNAAWQKLSNLRGPQGAPGVNPTIGENGNWFIGDEDTGIKARGDNGLTPYIGTNGNWWIGDTDMLVNALGGGTGTGTQGPKGDKGDTGNGVQKIEKTSSSGLIDTYTITYTNGTTSTFTITNGKDGVDGASGTAGTGTQGPKGDKGEDGNGIGKIEKTDTNGLVDTYTITFTNGTATQFMVVNGAKGDKGDKGDNGENGLTPYIGTNGDWWIGTTDTGLKAKGESAYEIYVRLHPEYTKSEEEWMDDLVNGKLKTEEEQDIENVLAGEIKSVYDADWALSNTLNLGEQTEDMWLIAGKIIEKNATENTVTLMSLTNNYSKLKVGFEDLTVSHEVSSFILVYGYIVRVESQLVMQNAKVKFEYEPAHAGTSSDPFDVHDAKVITSNFFGKDKDGYEHATWNEYYVKGKLLSYMTDYTTAEFDNVSIGSNSEHFTINHMVVNQQVYIGDEILVSGKLFKGRMDLYMLNGMYENPTLESVLTRGKSKVTVEYNKYAEVFEEIIDLEELDSDGYAENGTEISFRYTYTDKSYSSGSLEKITANGEDVECDSMGYYTFTLKEDTVISISFDMLPTGPKGLISDLNRYSASDATVFCLLCGKITASTWNPDGNWNFSVYYDGEDAAYYVYFTDVNLNDYLDAMELDTLSFDGAIIEVYAYVCKDGYRALPFGVNDMTGIKTIVRLDHDGTVSSPYTVEEAIQVSRTVGQYEFGYKQEYTQGTVLSIEGNESTVYTRVAIADLNDPTKTITIRQLKKGSSVLNVGDVITVYGVLHSTTYYGLPEIEGVYDHSPSVDAYVYPSYVLNN